MRSVAILAIAIAALGAVSTTGAPSTSLDASVVTGDSAAITEAEAREFTELLIEATDSMDPVSFCDQFAANLSMCERSLSDVGTQSTVISDWSRAELSIEQTHSGSHIVTFTRGDGAQSSIEVLSSGAEIRAVDPVFWAVRTIVG